MQEPESPPSSVEVGLVVDGKYRLIGLRGEGAMGSVWQAEHIKIGYPVAIKFLHKAIATLKDSRARFEREAKVAARLGEASRHVARVLDHGVLPTGMPFVVMELLEGEGLDAKLKREGKVAIEEVARIVSELARALEVAHAEGVVHRDLKPANVFLCRDGDGETTVKLLDFGVAKATLDNVSFATTRAGALIGTPSYMAPEQISVGIPVDARTDLWALAVITYRLLTGEMPFGRGTIEELALRIMTIEPKAPTELAPDLPRSIDAWMRRGLAKKQADRFASAREMAASLLEVAASPRGASVFAPVPSEAISTKREGSSTHDATLVSPPPMHADATLASPQETLLSADRPLSLPAGAPVKRPPAILAFLILGGLSSGILVTYFAARALQTRTPEKPALVQTSASTTASADAPASAPEPMLVVAPPAEAASASVAPTSPVSSHVASQATSSARVRASSASAKPRSSAAPARSSAPPADDWNSRNQM